MKTKIVALVLVLVIAAIAVVCVSCGKKEKEYQEELISFKVINQSGEKITEIAMEDTRNTSKMVAKPEEGAWEDGEIVGFSMMCAMENNAPDLLFSVTIENGNSLTTSILRKDLALTILSGEEGLQIQEESLDK